MSTMNTALCATCLALASMVAAAQTGAPPSHPVTGGTGAAATTGTASPTEAPTHPASGTSGATPAAAAAGSSKDNPTVNGYKDSTPAGGDAKRSNARSNSKPSPDTADRNPTSTDSMAKDNKPTHPATPAK